MSSNKRLLAAVALLLGAACNDDDTVVVTGALGNNFYVAWQIASQSRGNALTPCEFAGAATVQLTVLKQETGFLFDELFRCDAYQGLSMQRIGVPSTYDATLDLLSTDGVEIGRVNFDNLQISIDGTVDLGLQTFFVP